MEKDKNLKLELTDDAKEFLIDKGYNPDFGARPLRRAIEHHIEDPISEEILRGSYKGKEKILVSVKMEKTEDGEEKHLFFEAVGEVKTDEKQLHEVHEST